MLSSTQQALVPIIWGCLHVFIYSWLLVQPSSVNNTDLICWLKRAQSSIMSCEIQNPWIPSLGVEVILEESFSTLKFGKSCRLLRASGLYIHLFYFECMRASSTPLNMLSFFFCYLLAFYFLLVKLLNISFPSLVICMHSFFFDISRTGINVVAQSC